MNLGAPVRKLYLYRMTTDRAFEQLEHVVAPRIQSQRVSSVKVYDARYADRVRNVCLRESTGFPLASYSATSTSLEP